MTDAASANAAIYRVHQMPPARAFNLAASMRDRMADQLGVDKAAVRFQCIPQTANGKAEHGVPTDFEVIYQGLGVSPELLATVRAKARADGDARRKRREAKLDAIARGDTSDPHHPEYAGPNPR